MGKVNGDQIAQERSKICETTYFPACLLFTTATLFGCLVQQFIPIQQESYAILRESHLPQKQFINESSQQSSILNEVLNDEIIYNELMPSKEYLPTITEAMLRRSRVQIGDVTKFHGFLQKLHSANDNKTECAKILILGGSISAGSGLKRDKNELIYYEYLEKWLNAMYPCTYDQKYKDKHKVFSKAVGGTATNYVVNQFKELILDDLPNNEYDLILVEFTVNDVNYVPKTNGYKNSFDSISFYTELLIRSFYTYLPYDPLIIYIEMSWRTDQGFDSKPPYFNNAAFIHQQILYYYQIPIISMFRILHPIHLYQDIVYKNNKYYGNSPSKQFILDHTHPKADGHKFMSILLAHNIYNEYKIFISNDDKYILKTKYEINDKRILPMPWYTTDNDEKIFDIINNHGLCMIDFTQNEIIKSENISMYILSGDWILKPETEHMKYGLIATISNSYLIIEMNVKTIIAISYLRSHDNIGNAYFWYTLSKFDDETNKIKKTCQQLISNKRRILNDDDFKFKLKSDSEFAELNGRWNQWHHYHIQSGY